jgi:hypothetical protein
LLSIAGIAETMAASTMTGTSASWTSIRILPLKVRVHVQEVINELRLNLRVSFDDLGCLSDLRRFETS